VKKKEQDIMINIQKMKLFFNLGRDLEKILLLLLPVLISYISLLCLKDPARYFGKPSGDAIDLINVAINAQQAKNVFFKGFKTKIEKSPWFAGKYECKGRLY
jgi:hypothetical protein